MYRRLSREFQALAKDGNAQRMEMEDALKQLDRATRLIQSVMAVADDREWLEDMLLEGTVTLGQCTGLITEAFRLLSEANAEQQQPGNRQARRAASRARLTDE
jgi:hypothetical protein